MFFYLKIIVIFYNDNILLRLTKMCYSLFLKIQHLKTHAYKIVYPFKFFFYHQTTNHSLII